MSNRSLRYRSRSASRRLLSAATVAFVASSAFGFAMVTSVVTAASASAHAELIRITPDVDAQLTTAPTDVVLEFSEPVNASFTTVLVTSAAGVSVTSGKPVVAGAKVTQALVPHMAAGVYRVAFRVVSNDGHPVAGESRFTLTLAPTTSPSPSSRSESPPSASPSATPSVATTDVAPLPSPNAGQSGGLSRSGLAAAGAFALLLIGAGLLGWRRKHP